MTSEQFEAVIVGAGFGGIGAAIQLKRMGYQNFVILDREERREKIVRELDLHARRLGGRVHKTAAHQSGLLDVVPARRQPPPTVPPLRRPEVRARLGLS